MRHLRIVAVMLGLLATVVGQSLRIDEKASKVTLNGKIYAVTLAANSTQGPQSVVIKSEVIGPTGTEVASSSSTAQLKTGTNKLSVSLSLAELPKKRDDLLWYRLAYSVTANGSEVAHGILPSEWTDRGETAIRRQCQPVARAI